ncbi:MAG: M61 family metallopeptidase [Bacteroidetes bacterium]|nr:M61 family metallopeptidase [Bacteroidota bacterium]
MSNLHYQFSGPVPNRQILQIKFTIKENKQQTLKMCLPKWRPGRYELGNFAKNLMFVRALSQSGKDLKIEKTAIHDWEIQTEGHSEIVIEYGYYAAVLNAGSTWLHEDQMYVNPVNCCMYLPDRMDEACSLSIDVPDSYEIAIDCEASAAGTYTFSNFDRLADTPFIASAKLRHVSFSESEHNFHLWFQGTEELQEDRLVHDFRLFCREQLKTMGALPASNYHFLYQITADKSYHGVEHLNSTVIALGPRKELFGDAIYEELLGVSSHELFHAWNVKWIRPASMLPYRFDEENYSRLGWIYEGVTTWYGDMFLYRSGAFNFNQFKKTFDEKLRRHFSNYGRFNLSVGDSSFDTWLDGYVSGAPHRKTSIYTEGSLLTFILDSRMRAFNKDTKSFDNAMRLLLDEAKDGKGYTLDSLIRIFDSIGPGDHAEFLRKYALGTHDFEPELRKALRRIGLDIGVTLDFSTVEHSLGLRLNVSGSQAEVLLVAPASPAEKAGLATGDILVALNGMRWDLALSPQFVPDEKVNITYFRGGYLNSAELKCNTEKYFRSASVIMIENAGVEEKTAFKAWAGQDYPASK